ncbi:hypothetical protein SH2C18_34290 [Clostridium sediminicola]
MKKNKNNTVKNHEKTLLSKNSPNMKIKKAIKKDIPQSVIEECLSILG